MKIYCSERFNSHARITFKLMAVMCLSALFGSIIIFVAKDETGTRATIRYWEALQNEKAPADAEKTLAAIKQREPSPENLAKAALALRTLADYAEKSSSKIANLPVLNVDRELLDYASKQAAIHSEASVFLYEYADILDRSKETLDGNQWLFDFILSLAKHSRDGEKAFGNALRDQLASKGDFLANIKPQGIKIRERLINLMALASQLKVEEMQLRINLSKRYRVEFPTSSSSKSISTIDNQPLEKLHQSKVSTKQMMTDLIGKSFNHSAGRWNFDQLDEYKSFQVNNATPLGLNIVDYEIQTQVKGIPSGQEHTFKLKLRYQNSFGTWQLVSLAPS